MRAVAMLVALASVPAHALVASTLGRPCLARRAPALPRMSMPPFIAPASAAEPRSTPWAYSTFLEAIEANQIEKVSFTADGKQVPRRTRSRFFFSATRGGRKPFVFIYFVRRAAAQVLSIDKDGNRHESLVLPEQSAEVSAAGPGRRALCCLAPCSHQHNTASLTI